MEEKNGFFPVDVTISVPLEKGKMFLAGKFDDFIAFLSEEHSYVLYRFFVERDEEFKDWIREGGMTDDAF